MSLASPSEILGRYEAHSSLTHSSQAFYVLLEAPIMETVRTPGAAGPRTITEGRFPGRVDVLRVELSLSIKPLPQTQ